MSVFAMVLPARPTPEQLGGGVSACAEQMLLALTDAPAVVVISAGREPTVADVAQLVIGTRRVHVRGDASLVSAITTRGQVPRIPSGELGGVPAELAAAVHAARPDARFVAVTVPVGADPAAHAGASIALDGALAEVGGAVLLASGVLVCGARPAAFREELGAAFERPGTDALRDLVVGHPQVAGELTVLQHLDAIATARGRQLRLLAHASSGDAVYVVAAAS